MLFDLRGRRRRAVQATYLMLGAADGRRPGAVRRRRRACRAACSTPSRAAAGRAATARSTTRSTSRRSGSRRTRRTWCSSRAWCATTTRRRRRRAPERRATFPPEAKDDLRKAGAYWNRYASVADKPNPATAGFALQIYDTGALNKPKEAQKAASILAQAGNDAPRTSAWFHTRRARATRARPTWPVSASSRNVASIFRSSPGRPVSNA